VKGGDESKAYGTSCNLRAVGEREYPHP